MSGVLSGSSAIGAGLHVGGSLAIVAGQTIVKVAQLVEETSQQGKGWSIVIKPGQDPPVWKSPDGRWRRQLVGSKAYAAIGWIVFTVGNIMRFAAMRFTAQMVAAGLGSLQFVVIPIISNAFLGQPYEWSTFFSICVVLLGNLLIILYGPPEVSFSLTDLRRLWCTPSMVTFVVLTLLLLASMHAAVLYLDRRKRRREADVRAQWRAKAKKEAPLDTFLHALLFSARAAFIGAWSVMFSKSLTYIISAPWPTQFIDWYSYLVVVAFLGTAASWIRSTNSGLHQFSSSLIIPLMQAWWMTLAIITGGIYFHEFDSMPEGQVALLVLGMLLAIGGALAMGCSAFLSEQHAMISYVVLPEQDLASHTSLALPASQDPTAAASTADWQHNLAALQHRISHAGEKEGQASPGGSHALSRRGSGDGMIHVTATSTSLSQLPRLDPSLVSLGTARPTSDAGSDSGCLNTASQPLGSGRSSSPGDFLDAVDGRSDAVLDVDEDTSLMAGQHSQRHSSSADAPSAWHLQHIGDYTDKPSILAQLQQGAREQLRRWQRGY
ncbi:hypothetical protein WJX72_000154 [[Myrmecia] bisecta]|uniref:Probable magnesium transporter n=1 Tax=[Myrmecia] bisecta TaxID=41462 RepID=A0AAW1PNX0_9CHLO